MKCGVGDYASCLAEALRALPDTKVKVLTDIGAAQPDKRKTDDLLPEINGWKASDIPKIVRIIRRSRPDIVHIQFPSQGYRNRRLPFFLPMLARLAGAAVVQTWHEYHKKCAFTVYLNGFVSSGIVVVRPDYREVMSPCYRGLVKHREFLFIPNASTIPSVTLSDKERFDIRSRFNAQSKHLVVYFGFASYPKGIDLLFEVADPARHRIVLVCDLDREDPYHRSILDRMARPDWERSASATGFLSPDRLARLLAAADAVVLPFREGGGVWNTSIHGVTSQGTFLLTTSRETHGYDGTRNIYFAIPGDLENMRTALDIYAGRKNPDPSPGKNWREIAEEHLRLYRKILIPSRSK